MVSVTEHWDGIHVRQSRFWESGPIPEEDPTLWYFLFEPCCWFANIILHRVIPLCVSYLADDGNVLVERTLILDEREKVLTVRPDKFLKLNADTTGVCTSPSRFILSVNSLKD